MDFRTLLGNVSAGINLSVDEMSFAIDQLMQGLVPENEMGLFLTALHIKGESADEIAGAAQAMRRHMTPIHSNRTTIVDTCGTGGVGSKLFNISTSAAIVTAAAGVAVAKHGNRSVTSKSGSANVLSALGVNIDASVAVVERCLNELGICFCFAPRLHPAMKHVAPIRQKLGQPTIFNLLGPLCNPASANYQLMGVGRMELRARMGSVLAKLGTKRAAVISGTGGLGEVTLGGVTYVTLVENQECRELIWKPSDFGLSEADMNTLEVDGPDASAQVIREVLSGARGSARDVVVANAAAALWVSGADSSLANCAQLAAQAIDSKRASQLLTSLAELTSRPT